MDSGKSVCFSGSTLDADAGSSSGERGDRILTQIKDKLVLDDMEFSGIGRQVSISDLVWCKVLGQPWWPGKAISDSIVLTKGDECFDNDSYLVVCFGNNSFAWYDALNVKPFWENFLQLAKRSNTKSFQKAVDCALEEVSRRIKYTLTCRCMPRQIYVDVRCPFWAVDAGSDKDSSNDDVPEEVILSTASFVGQELVDYIKVSSVSAFGAVNRLVLEAAKAQLSTLFFWRNRSRKLPAYASLFAEPDGDLEYNSPRDNRKKDDHMRDFAGQNKISGSCSSSKNASVVVGGYPSNVDFVFSIGSSDKGKGKFTNESGDSLARGDKGRLLEEPGNGAGFYVCSTETDLMKKTQSSNTPMPNLENRAFAGVPMTAEEKQDDCQHQTSSRAV